MITSCGIPGSTTTRLQMYSKRRSNRNVKKDFKGKETASQIILHQTNEAHKVVRLLYSKLFSRLQINSVEIHVFFSTKGMPIKKINSSSSKIICSYFFPSFILLAFLLLPLFFYAFPPLSWALYTNLTSFAHTHIFLWMYASLSLCVWVCWCTIVAVNARSTLRPSL